MQGSYNSILHARWRYQRLLQLRLDISSPVSAVGEPISSNRHAQWRPIVVDEATSHTLRFPFHKAHDSTPLVSTMRGTKARFSFHSLQSIFPCKFLLGLLVDGSMDECWLAPLEQVDTCAR